MDIYGWLGESLLSSKNYPGPANWTDGRREERGEREPRTQWDRGWKSEREEKKKKKKGGRVEGGNIRPFSLLFIGMRCYGDQSWNLNRIAGSLNNMHIIILPVVKLQLMQAGRCVRRNRAWAECMQGYKAYTLCLLCTLNTHFSASLCVWDVCCIIYGGCFC